jgi:hypothetical protein
MHPFCNHNRSIVTYNTSDVEFCWLENNVQPQYLPQSMLIMLNNGSGCILWPTMPTITHEISVHSYPNLSCHHTTSFP